MWTADQLFLEARHLDLDRGLDRIVRIMAEDRDYPRGIPPVAAVFADAARRVWIGLTEPPPERLTSGELPAVRRWVVFEEGGPMNSGDTKALQFGAILAMPPRSHPLYADAEGVLLVRNDKQFDVAYVEWYPFVEG